MRIGIDISQVVFEGTGVSRYIENLTLELLKIAHTHSFVLFGVSRGRYDKLLAYTDKAKAMRPDIEVKLYKFPLFLMEILWNVFHIFPIEKLTGDVDVFISSDWIQPPLKKALGITTIHDLSTIIDPLSHDQKVISVHSRRLKRAISECVEFLVDSKSTKADVMKYLKLGESKLHVVYPGFNFL